jgi:uncharacterized membrane-anchored protein
VQMKEVDDPKPNVQPFLIFVNSKGCNTFLYISNSMCTYLQKSMAASWCLIVCCYTGSIGSLLSVYCTYWIIKGNYYFTYNCVLFSTFLSYSVGVLIWAIIMKLEANVEEGLDG